LLSSWPMVSHDDDIHVENGFVVFVGKARVEPAHARNAVVSVGRCILKLGTIDRASISGCQGATLLWEHGACLQRTLYIRLPSFQTIHQISRPLGPFRLQQFISMPVNAAMLHRWSLAHGPKMFPRAERYQLRFRGLNRGELGAVLRRRNRTLEDLGAAKSGSSGASSNGRRLAWMGLYDCASLLQYTEIEIWVLWIYQRYCMQLKRVYPVAWTLTAVGTTTVNVLGNVYIGRSAEGMFRSTPLAPGHHKNL
jgi:hypothetical protein